jgi:ubiquinone biosynthesis protein
MEFIEGIKISDTTALRAAGIDQNALMRTLVEAYCEQIFEYGFFHADPHPGNLLVQPSTADRPGGARLVFVDFGLAKELPPDFHRGVIAMATAMLQNRVEAMAEALLDLGFETRDASPRSLHEIARALIETARRLQHHSSLNPEIVSRAGEELTRLVRENPIVRVPSHVVLLGRVIALLSGLGHTLDARMDMLKTILSYALPTPANAPGSSGAKAKERARGRGNRATKGGNAEP